MIKASAHIFESKVASEGVGSEGATIDNWKLNYIQKTSTIAPKV